MNWWVWEQTIQNPEVDFQFPANLDTGLQYVVANPQAGVATNSTVGDGTSSLPCKSKERCGDPWIQKAGSNSSTVSDHINIWSFHTTFPAFGRESRVICKPSCRMMSETPSPSDRSQKARRTSFRPFQIWCRWGHTACRCQTSAFCKLDFERTTYTWSYPTQPRQINYVIMNIDITIITYIQLLLAKKRCRVCMTSCFTGFHGRNVPHWMLHHKQFTVSLA